MDTDIVNLWKKTGNKDTDDLNIIRTWLVGGTDGQTYSVSDLIEIDFDRIEKEFEYDWDDIGCVFDEILGYKHDWHLDDEGFEERAKKVFNGLRELNRKVNEHPELYFQLKHKTKKIVYKCNALSCIGCEDCVGEDNVCIHNGECPFRVPADTANVD